MDPVTWQYVCVEPDSDGSIECSMAEVCANLDRDLNDDSGQGQGRVVEACCLERCLRRAVAGLVEEDR